jgi:hypothetical protein
MERILAPTDPSELSCIRLEYAPELARGLGVRKLPRTMTQIPRQANVFEMYEVLQERTD